MCCPQFSLNLEVELDNDPGKFGGSASSRKCTDVFALIIVVLFFGAVIGLTIYCILNSEIDKLRNGYDDSGNICGKNNIKPDSMQFEGFGENMENKKYVLIKQDGALGKTKECVENCSMRGFSRVYNYCTSDKKILPYYIEMRQYGICILLVWCQTGVYFFLFVTFRNIQSAFLKCCFKILNPLLLFILAAYFLLWVGVILEEKVRSNFLLIIFISLVTFATITALIYIPFGCSKKIILKIDLATQLCQEAWDVIDIISLLRFLSFLSSFLIAGFLIILIYCCLWLQTFSYLDQVNDRSSNDTRTDYVQHPIATVTSAFLIYAFLLLCEIVKNCLCLVVGGCVAQWYFIRRDGGLSRPIRRSVVNLLKYHLGTVCCGSIILPPIYVVRSVVNAIKGAASGNNKESVYTCSCRLLSETCFATFTTTLDCFSQDGFIMTAIYGCSFCVGTVRANKLLKHNSFNGPAINTFGNIILEIYKLLITVPSSLMFLLYSVKYIMIEDYMKHDTIWIAIFILLSYFIADCFLSIYKMIFDTLFLCFCEDCLYNNGTTKPYFMSPNFAQFVENANKYVDPVKWKDVADKWEKGPKLLY